MVTTVNHSSNQGDVERESSMRTTDGDALAVLPSELADLISCYGAARQALGRALVRDLSGPHIDLDASYANVARAQRQLADWFAGER